MLHAKKILINDEKKKQKKKPTLAGD